MVNREFTAIYQKHGKWTAAWIEEIPGVNTQGRTKQEARRNLREALGLILAENRRLAGRRILRKHERERLRIAIPA